MRLRMMGVISASLLLSTSAASAAELPDAARWQAMARADLDTVHALVLEAHPGVIDEANPGFGQWVENGYRRSKDLLAHVSSYDTAMAAVRYYTTGFEDGHLLYSDNARRGYPVVVTGWNIVRKHGRYEVFTTLPDWPVALPPIGSAWTGCDGLAAEELLQEKVAPFVDRRDTEQSRSLRASSLWQRHPVRDDLRECSFVTSAGGSIRLAVAYRPITEDQFFSSLADVHDGGSRAVNDFAVHDGVLWIRAGNFMLRDDAGDRAELERMLAGIAKVKAIRTIVFDVRGNNGGDSGVGDRIFEAATGGLEFEQTDLDKLPRYFAQWRVSNHLLRYLDTTVERLKALYGADSDRVREESAFRSEVAAAKAAGKAWVEQDAGRKITRADVVARRGHLRRFDARMALLTDSGCASACLDFADAVLKVPGVVHVGQATSADSVYMVGSQAKLPSGNILVLPVKVWRNRIRANNEALVPDVRIDLDSDEARVRASVLRALDR